MTALIILAYLLWGLILPVGILAGISLWRYSRDKAEGALEDAVFEVRLPTGVLVLGIALDGALVLLVLGFTFFSKERPHVLMYVTIGAFRWLGLYLALKALCFKAVVKREGIRVYSIITRPYAFSFRDIVSAVRQVKNNRVQSERILLKTAAGQKLIVERAEEGYERFRDLIAAKVDAGLRKGF